MGSDVNNTHVTSCDLFLQVLKDIEIALLPTANFAETLLDNRKSLEQENSKTMGKDGRKINRIL